MKKEKTFNNSLTLFTLGNKIFTHKSRKNIKYTVKQRKYSIDPMMKLFVVLLLGLLAVGSSASCLDTLNTACNEDVCTVGDLGCTVGCFVKHNAMLKKAGCGFPEETLTLLTLAVEEPREFAKALQASPLAAIIDKKKNSLGLFSDLEAVLPRGGGSALPTVMGHGMGDSCFNEGMKEITADVGKHIGSYSVCVPTGDNWLQDTLNGFLLNMDKSVTVFANKIKADDNLKNGFNAIGFSQGNSLIRGYYQKYNGVNGYPPLHMAMHVHGTVSGVAGIPQCDPSSGFCKTLAHLCGELSPNSLVQGILFQADYFRDPTKVNETAYKTYSQLAQMNNEGNTVDKTINENFGKVEKFVMVKALGDTMVYPNAGEWWGHFKDGADDYRTVVPLNQTNWYKEDLFGLKTAFDAGKMHFETTPGNHLQFTEKELFGWIDKYFQK